VQALELILMLLAAVAALNLLAVRLVVPTPALLVLGGGVLAAIPELPRPNLSPEVIFLVFVPPLLYWTAFNTSWRDFRTNLRSISLLAVGLVLATMSVVAVVAHALAPEITWGAAFALGAIVSPPDPVAVTAVTRRLGIARDIVTILEGEGLVNDATALVAYRMAVGAVVAGGFSLGEAAGGFAWSAAGGLGIGLAAGAAIAWVRTRIGKVPVVENTISVLTPFAAYIPAERLGASGVLAVVAVGLYMGRRGPRVISAETRTQANAMWEMISFFLEGLVFILIGLEMPFVLAALHEYSIGFLATLAAAISGAVILVRLVWVFPGGFVTRTVLRRSGRTQERPPWRAVAFVGWAGLRGGDSLVIALALPLTVAGGGRFPGRDLILFLTFAVIFVTLVLQGLTLKAVIRLLGLRPDTRGAEEALEARERVFAAGLDALKTLPAEDAAAKEALAALEERYRHRSHRYAARLRGQRHARDESRSEALRRMRLRMIAAEREALIKLRDGDVISDDVMRGIQRDLDLEQILLESREAAQDAMEQAPAPG
jgi:CPA1 family monovalent cation:H+ antiporter